MKGSKYFLFSTLAVITFANFTTNNREFKTPRFFKIADSSDHGYTYGYAPSLTKQDGIYHTFYCSSPAHGEGLDAIRYVFSKDGLNWSLPKVILKAKPRINSKTGRWTNRAACDPSVVYYQNYYYLFYSNQHQTGSGVGNHIATQTTISVARSHQINGLYLTYTDRGTWEENPADVKMIILPQVERSELRKQYGAGQQTVIVKNGQLYLWYTDDSLHPTEGPRIYFLKSNNPVNWKGKPVPTNLRRSASVDIKYDAIRDRFVLVQILRSHQTHPSLAIADSTDGINWISFQVIEPTFPAFAHNVGVSSDRQGYLLEGENPIIAFGAPTDLHSQDRWGNWDLFGVRLKLASPF